MHCCGAYHGAEEAAAGEADCASASRGSARGAGRGHYYPSRVNTCSAVAQVRKHIMGQKKQPLEKLIAAQQVGAVHEEQAGIITILLV